eukprot:7266635-Ditylum_brightwellii.AAC.1
MSSGNSLASFSASAYGLKGTQLWDKDNEGVVSPPNMCQFKAEWRFKHIKRLIPNMWKDKSHAEEDPWWNFVTAVDDFNENRKKTDAASISKPQTTATGDLPHLSFIERKPEPLGVEFKNSTCGVIGMFLAMELQRGRADTCRPDNANLGATAAVSLHLAKMAQHCGQNTIQDTENDPNASPDIFEGDSWFASVTTS